MPQTYLLLDEYRRRLALRAVQLAKEGSEVEISTYPKRTGEQNAWLHGIITDIAEQIPDPRTGEFQTVKWWKPRLTLSWLIDKKQEYEIITPFMEASGQPEFGILVPHTSDLKVDKCAEFIQWLYPFGVERGVVFKERQPEPPPPETDR